MWFVILLPLICCLTSAICRLTRGVGVAAPTLYHFTALTRCRGFTPRQPVPPSPRQRALLPPSLRDSSLLEGVKEVLKLHLPPSLREVAKRSFDGGSSHFATQKYIATDFRLYRTNGISHCRMAIYRNRVSGYIVPLGVYNLFPITHCKDKHGLLRMEAVFGLVKNLICVLFKGFGGDFLTAVCGQTMHNHCVLFSQ